MIRKLSVVTAVAGLALVVAAPALGKGQPVTTWRGGHGPRSVAGAGEDGAGVPGPGVVSSTGSTGSARLRARRSTRRTRSSVRSRGSVRALSERSTTTSGTTRPSS